jgi:hypothetical protein
MLLLGFSVFRSESEQVLGMSAFAFGIILVGAGVIAYMIKMAIRPEGWAGIVDEKPGTAM